jgi:predicted HicB family RNase H-like nuclease
MVRRMMGRRKIDRKNKKQIHVWIEKNVHAQLKLAAERNVRSVNGEVIKRLSDSFVEKTA